MNARRGLKSWLVTTMSENAAVDRLNALVSKLVAAIRPPPNVSVSEWATQNRVLSPEASAEQGRWRNSRTPYLVEIMDAFSDPRLHHIRHSPRCTRCALHRSGLPGRSSSFHGTVQG